MLITFKSLPLSDSQASDWKFSPISYSSQVSKELHCPEHNVKGHSRSTGQAKYGQISQETDTGEERKRNYQPEFLSRNLEKIHKISASFFSVFLINGRKIQSPKTFFRFCGQHSFLPSMYGNKGTVISFMTMTSNRIKCSSLGDYPVYAIHTTRTNSPMNRGKGVIGADYLQPRSDIKILMGQLLRCTRIVHGCAVVGQHLSFPPRSGPRCYSQFHQRKISGEIQTKQGSQT